MKTGEGNLDGDGSNTTATAAKVAAEVAPDVVTGGIVAETGPRPDFSLWTVEDDVLLKNAVEVGAAMEALAKGAFRFSRKFTVRELRERWRALLYDPEIAAQAASRMVEAEAALSNVPPNPKSLSEHRNTKILARKRRARSIRSLYYKKRKRMAAEKLVAAVMLENELESDFGRGDEMAADVVHSEEGGALPPLLVPLPSGLEDPSLPGGLLSPKEARTDFEEPTLNQMVSLLASGGVGPVIKSLPVVKLMDNAIDPEHEVSGGISRNGCIISGHDELLKIEASQPDEKRMLGSELVCECSESRHTQESVVVIPMLEEVRVVLPSETGTAEGVGGTVGADLPLPLSSETEELVEQLQIVQTIQRDLVQNHDHTLDSMPKDEISKQKGVRVKPDLFDESDHKPQNPSSLSATHHGQGEETQLPNTVTAGPNILKNMQEAKPASDVIRTEQPRIGGAEEDGVTFNPEDPSHNSDPTCKSAVIVREQLKISGELSDISSRLLNTECAPSKNKTKAEIGTPPSCQETIKEDKLTSELRVEKLEGSDNGLSGQHEGMVEEKGDVQLNDGSHDEDFHMGVPDDELLHHDSPMLDVDHCDPEDATDHMHNQPVDLGLGSIICTLNMQDTEIPILDEALPFPVWATPPSPLEEVDEEEDDIYHMEQTMPTDDTMVSRSPGIFYDLEEMSNPALEEQILWDHGEAVDNHDLLYRHSDHASPPNAAVMDQGLSPCRISEQRLDEDEKEEVEDDEEEGEEEEDEEEAEDEEEEDEKGISSSGTQVPPQLGTLELGERCSNFGVFQKAPPNGPGIVLSLPRYTTEQTTLLHATDAENFPSDFDPSTCQEVLVGVGASREVSSCREDTDHLSIEEEEPESEAEMARFSDVETMIINMDLSGVDDEFSARAESRQMYRQQRRTLLRLEQGVGAAMQRNLTHKKALAILYGRHLRYYISKTKVLMGRGTHDNAVDIDLGKEGPANKVSRQQAVLKLKEDGVFYLRNLGRRSLTVNNNAVDAGQRAILGSNCLIEVGGMRFIFEINKRLVKQQVERMRE